MNLAFKWTFICIPESFVHEAQMSSFATFSIGRRTRCVFVPLIWTACLHFLFIYYYFFFTNMYFDLLLQQIIVILKVKEPTCPPPLNQGPAQLSQCSPRCWWPWWPLFITFGYNNLKRNKNQNDQITKSKNFISFVIGQFLPGFTTHKNVSYIMRYKWALSALSTGP